MGSSTPCSSAAGSAVSIGTHWLRRCTVGPPANLNAHVLHRLSIRHALKHANPSMPTQAGLLPNLLPEFKMAGNGPFAVTSFAISLLLVFRCRGALGPLCAAAWCGAGALSARCVLLLPHSRLMTAVPAASPRRCGAASRSCLLPSACTCLLSCPLPMSRTNASYARWLDARKSWGKLINRSRDLTRQV